jgi:hypothetical protein
MELNIKSFNEAVISQSYTKMNFYNTIKHNRLRYISSFFGKISNCNNFKRSLSDIKSKSKYRNMYIQALIHNEGIKRISEVSNNEKDK